MSGVRGKRRWRIAEQVGGPARELAAALGVSPIVAHLLLLRGVDAPEEAARFLAPSLADLSDPLSLTGMAEAVARISRARDAGERILIFGDYDVDGVSATAILLNGLRRFGVTEVDHGMPLRLTEGYGLSPDHVTAAHEAGVSLVITVDNGISAHEAAERARALGVDLIITDHHSIENGLPEAVAVLNPKREPEDYVGRDLCGAGVAFKLATALNGTPNDLDIAALGTVADIVPLLGENRVIVALGLKHMTRHRRLGLDRLARAAGVGLADVTSEHIGFQLAPRLNAAGRLDDALASLRLLMTDCPDEAAAMAGELSAANDERRQIEQGIFDDAVAGLDAFLTETQRGIVVARQGWHAGVIGIVASRLQRRYGRPVVMIAIDEDGTGRASARSGPGFDMVSALAACQDLLVRFGGHRAAAGMTILEDNIDAFREAFEREALRQLGDGDLFTELPIDVLAGFSEVDSALLADLQRLEPFGHENPSPVFCTLGVSAVPQSVRVLKDRHLKLSLRQDGKVFSAIGFGMAEEYYSLDLSRPVDVAYVPQFNSWRGETTIQLLLKDMRPAE